MSPVVLCDAVTQIPMSVRVSRLERLVPVANKGVEGGCKKLVCSSKRRAMMVLRSANQCYAKVRRGLQFKHT